MATKAVTLFSSQSQLSHKISRFVKNLKKKGVANITVGKTQSRLDELKECWDQFKTNHGALQDFSDLPEVMTNNYFVQDNYSLTEEEYLDQKGTLLDILDRLQRRPQDAPQTSAGTNATNSNGSDSNGTLENRKRVSLPRIPLPKFSGLFQEWQAFRDLFGSLVGDDASLNDVDKLHYLKTSLSGEAELLVRNLPTIGANFQRAWTILTDRYKNSRLLLQAQLSRLFEIAPMVKESSAELKRLLYSTNDICAILEGMEKMGPTDSYLLVHLTVMRLDKQTRREWESHVSEKTVPLKFAQLKAFLDQRVIALEAIEQSLSSVTRDNAKPTANSKAKQVAHAISENPDNVCGLCKKTTFSYFATSTANKNRLSENPL